MRSWSLSGIFFFVLRLEIKEHVLLCGWRLCSDQRSSGYMQSPMAQAIAGSSLFDTCIYAADYIRLADCRMEQLPQRWIVLLARISFGMCVWAPSRVHGMVLMVDHSWLSGSDFLLLTTFAGWYLKWVVRRYGPCHGLRRFPIGNPVSIQFYTLSDAHHAMHILGACALWWSAMQLPFCDHRVHGQRLDQMIYLQCMLEGVLQYFPHSGLQTSLSCGFPTPMVRTPMVRCSYTLQGYRFIILLSTIERISRLSVEVLLLLIHSHCRGMPVDDWHGLNAVQHSCRQYAHPRDAVHSHGWHSLRSVIYLNLLSICIKYTCELCFVGMFVLHI